MNLRPSYEPYKYFRFLISDCQLVLESAIENRQSAILLTNRIYLQGRVSLPVTLGPLVLFAPLLFEDNDFPRAAVINHRRGHLCAVNQRRANFCFFACAHGENLESDTGADFSLK